MTLWKCNLYTGGELRTDKHGNEHYTINAPRVKKRVVLVEARDRLNAVRTAKAQNKTAEHITARPLNKPRWS